MRTLGLDATIRHVTEFRSHVGVVAFRALAPDDWVPALRKIASDTLNVLAETEDEQAMVFECVGSVDGRVFSGGRRFVRFSMDGPLVAGSRKDRLFVGQMEDGLPTRVGEARQFVEQWVEEEKTIDARDGSRSTAQIASRLNWIMGIHPKSRNTDKPRTAAMDSARDSLKGALVEWSSGQQSKAMDRQRSRSWLSAVSLAWQSYLRVELPEAMGRRLGRAWSQGIQAAA